MLHVRCGDDILPSLERAGIPGRMLSWSDPLCEGPWPSTDRALVRPMRARFLAERLDLSFMATLSDLADADDALAAAADEDEVVLWFEHDLHDQAILAWLLHELAPLAGLVPLSLVQVDSHPSVARFIGLGQLGPDDLHALFLDRRPVSDAMFAEGRRAVQAWTAERPDDLELLRSQAGPLVHLAPAVTRYLQEYPELGTGLSRTDRWALEASAAGAATAAAVFAAVQAREARPWMGDTMCFARLRQLAEGAAPLLRLDGAVMGADAAAASVRPTALAREVLAGERDWLALRPQERWMGGVHLRPGGPDWRWDERTGRVVRAGGSPGATR